VDHVGIDVHKKESQVCILTEEGEVVEVRIATTRECFREVLGGRARHTVPDPAGVSIDHRSARRRSRG
jgi:hypothetical protein